MAVKDHLLFICLTLPQCLEPIRLLFFAACDESEANQEAAAPSKSSGGSARDSGCHMPPDSSPEDGDLDLISQCFSPADVTVTWELKYRLRSWWCCQQGCRVNTQIYLLKLGSCYEDNYKAFYSCTPEQTALRPNEIWLVGFLWCTKM